MGERKHVGVFGEADGERGERDAIALAVKFSFSSVGARQGQ